MKPPQILQEIISHTDRKQEIYARISNYHELFEKTNEGIVLTDKGIELARKTKAKSQ